MTPEERSAYSKRLNAKNTTPKGGRKVGVPRSLTVKQFNARVAEQKPIIERIMKKMADKGQLPDDPRAVEAIETGLTIMRTQEDQKLKLNAARMILDFTKAKPTTKIEHTVKTAEDYLDELADDAEG